MSDRIRVFVFAEDPISQAGITAQLRGQPGVQVVADGEVDEAAAAIVVVDEVDDDAVRIVRAVQRNGCPRVVLVAARLDETGLLHAIEAGASAFVRRAEAGPGQLFAAARAAVAGDGAVPADLLGRMLDQVARLQRHVLSPRGITFAGLTDREVDVLRLVAEGLDTAEIARTLAYSERTIKNVIHDVTTRLQLRNRSHAVAYAVRAGLI